MKLIANKKRKGFTLVELVVVMLIIAILATIGIMKFVEFRERANDTAAKQNIRHIRNLCMMWKTKHPEEPFPDGVADISYTGSTSTGMDRLFSYIANNAEASVYTANSNYRYVYMGPSHAGGVAYVRVIKLYGNDYGWNAGHDTTEPGTAYSLTE